MVDEYEKRIASQLAKALPKGSLDEFKLRQGLFAEEEAEPELTEKRHDSIFKQANKVAITKRIKVSYSNFHTWEHFRNFANGNAASEAASPEMLQHFQNCFYMAYDCAEDLRARLRSHEDLAEYESHVMLATDCWEQQATSARQYHCIVVLPLPEACIIIDPVAHSWAIKVPLSTTWENGFSAFRYCYAGLNNLRFLVNASDDPQTNLSFPATGNTPTHNYPYRTLRNGFEGGIRNLVYPADNYRGRTPSNRSMFIYDVWDKQPSSNLDSVKVRLGSGRTVKFVVETCRLSFSFEEQWIWVSNIPREWLEDFDNAYFLKRLEPRNYFYTEDELWRGFQVDLNTRVDIQQGYLKRTLENIEFMQELVEALGMRKGELMRMANVMLEYWQEEDRTKPKKDLKRKR
ncbi:hypothetical protein P3342_010223 [Pyrenophora teres f. teres]|nr:hypothetical protein PTNB85_07779 [Pyrenophora teres f. teres]KAE8841908.1 hypothetical protein HRS9122_06034 [Pyrenophora teres f. teres]KAE8860012.1 hypothetical protein PTNB29_07243 [Pyrenophora teres f. teres]KAK1918752.1 hypothetical protein P3342_010223 [Pyrenophora teres f. teres]